MGALGAWNDGIVDIMNDGSNEVSKCNSYRSFSGLAWMRCIHCIRGRCVKNI